MDTTKIARLLEYIKYLTLKKMPYISVVKADIEKFKYIEDEYVQLSGNYSFTFQSIIADYGEDYAASHGKSMTILFNQKPIEGSTPDSTYEIITDSNGLMTPAIIKGYDENGKTFKKYIFPAIGDGHSYMSYNEWYQTTLIDDNDKNYSRPSAMTILVEEPIVPDVTTFDKFLNESFTNWTSRFNTAKELAKSGDFKWFNLYDPDIYMFELSFEDRIQIIDYMAKELNWTWIFEGYGGTNGVDEYELFSSLITSTNKDDGKKFYDYMFEIDSSGETTKTNLQVYKDKLDDDKLYGALIQTLIKFFYSTKTVTEFKDGFRYYLLYPIGLYEKYGGGNITFNLDTEEDATPGPYILGVKYDISTVVDVETGNLKIKVNSAYRYKENASLPRLEFEGFKNNIGKNEEWQFDEIIYVTSFLSNKKLEGLDVPYASVIPIPAFALPWLVEKNNETEDIIDLIEEGATYVGVIFPVFEIFEGVNIIYNLIGIGFTLTSNILDAGLADQIQRFDDFQSNALGHPYTKGRDFLDTYYLFSAIYGGISLGKAIEKADNKIKVLIEFENLLGIKGVIGDIKSYMALHEENPDAFIIIENEMNQLEIDCKSYRFLKK